MKVYNFSNDYRYQRELEQKVEPTKEETDDVENLVQTGGESPAEEEGREAAKTEEPKPTTKETKGKGRK